jgi:putative flippase GtrA
MARPVADLYERTRHLVPELAKFGVVGGIGAVVDLGGAGVLHSAYHVGPLASKGISVTAATAITYLGSRFWTFRHRENQPMHREAVLFIVLNVVGLIIAEAVIGLTTYVLGLKDPLAYNAASVLGTGLGTIFRFYAYRKWVFLAPAEHPAPAGATAGEMPDYAPRGLDPAYFDQPAAYSSQAPLDNSFIPNGAVAPPLVTAAVPARETPAGGIPAWETPSWESPSREGPAWDEHPAWDPPSPLPSARPESAGQRTPGRHRKR